MLGFSVRIVQDRGRKVRATGDRISMAMVPEKKAIEPSAVPVLHTDVSGPLVRTLRHRALFAVQICLFLGLLWQFAMLYKSHYIVAAAAAAAGVVDGNVVRGQSASTASSSNLPDYYVTKPELLPGPTPTGVPAFLAETNPAPFPGVTYVAPSPLETQVPIVGQVGNNDSIYHMHGQLSHYFSNPTGFGVDEYPLPANASIAQLHVLHRHGSRYPTKGSGIETLAARIKNYTTGVLGDVTFEGQLSFLNGWKYKLGEEIMVPVGKQELFDSGTLHQYLYGHLNPTNGTKIIARSTTQDRMLRSAEYFLAGFYGLDWTQNATLVLARENLTGIFNNTMAGYQNCNNSNLAVNQGGNNASLLWEAKYLANATARLHADAPGFNWTLADSYNAQSMCAYETVALGYSAFCSLFTYEEWEGYEYSVDIQFAGGFGFQSPTARATGVGYVAEIVARLQHHLINSSFAQINTTLDSNPATFPLNQTLNFDFSHDTNIMAILTAFGLKQFDTYLPPDHILRNRSLVVSHMEPFGARLDMEIIDTPSPLSGDRSHGTCYEEGKPTKYIHFILNQRTVPLGKSIPTCGNRQDGWCELETFLKAQVENLKTAEYEYSCFGKYAAVPYGTLTNGVPLPA